jgi:hypothetical protein
VITTVQVTEATSNPAPGLPRLRSISIPPAGSHTSKFDTSEVPTQHYQFSTNDSPRPAPDSAHRDPLAEFNWSQSAPGLPFPSPSLAPDDAGPARRPPPTHPGSVPRATASQSIADRCVKVPGHQYQPPELPRAGEDPVATPRPAPAPTSGDGASGAAMADGDAGRRPEVTVAHRRRALPR